MEGEIDRYYKNLDPLHPDNFRSRSERAQRMRYPESSQYRLIIPSNLGGWGFSAKDADCSKFPQLPRAIVKQTADEATKICEKIYAQKKKEEVKDRHKWSYLALRLSLFLCIGGFFVFMVPLYYPPVQSENTIYVGFLCQGLAVLISLLVIVRTLCMKRQRVGVEEAVMEKLTKFVQEENEKVYHRSNMQLLIGYKFLWLEVRLMMN